MKKLVQYLTIAALGVSLLTGCKKKDPTPTALASVGTNTTTGSVDASTMTRTIYVSGLSGNINDVKVRFQGSCTWTSDLELYLKSPSGKILQLCADEARASNNSSYPSIDLTFTDTGSSLATWTSSSTGSFTGTFKPRGYTASSSSYLYTGTTSSFSGYKGDAPNGTWTLYVCDDSSSDILYFNSWELFLSTSN